MGMERVFLPQTDDYTSEKINVFKPIEKKTKHCQFVLIYFLFKVR